MLLHLKEKRNTASFEDYMKFIQLKTKMPSALTYLRDIEEEEQA